MPAPSHAPTPLHTEQGFPDSAGGRFHTLSKQQAEWRTAVPALSCLETAGPCRELQETLGGVPLPLNPVPPHTLFHVTGHGRDACWCGELWRTFSQRSGPEMKNAGVYSCYAELPQVT